MIDTNLNKKELFIPFSVFSPKICHPKLMININTPLTSLAVSTFNQQIPTKKQKQKLKNKWYKVVIKLMSVQV